MLKTLRVRGDVILSIILYLQKNIQLYNTDLLICGGC